MSMEIGNEELMPFVERIEQRLMGSQAKRELQIVLMERIGKLLWPKGFIGKDGRHLPNPMDRFLASIAPDDETGCWHWVRTVHENGYAVFPLGGRQWLAHRWVYESLKGPIPDRLVIDHRCSNKDCVNIGHLEAVTQSVNVRRALKDPIRIPSFLSARLP